MASRAPLLPKGRDLNTVDTTSPLYRPPPAVSIAPRQVLGKPVEVQPTDASKLFDDFFKSILSPPPNDEPEVDDVRSVSELEATDVLIAMGTARPASSKGKGKASTSKRSAKPKETSPATNSTDF